MTDDLDVSEADRDLIAELAKRGLSVTARQLRRWRDEGRIPSPIQVSKGRGYGRRSVRYPAETADQAAAVAAIIGRGVKLRHVVLALFVERQPVTLDQVRAAYRSQFDELERGIPDADDPDDRPDLLAQQLASQASTNPLGRSWSRRTPGRGEKHLRELEDGVSALMSVAFGTVSGEDLNTKAIANMVGLPEEDAENLRSMPVTSFSAQRNLIDTLTDEEWITLRDTAHDVSELLIRKSTDPDAIHTHPGFADVGNDDIVSRALMLLHIAELINQEPDFFDVVRSDLATYIADQSDTIM